MKNSSVKYQDLTSISAHLNLDLYKEQLPLHKEKYGDNSSQVAILIDRIANAYQDNGNYLKALTMYMDVLEIGQNLNGDPYKIATIMMKIAKLHKMLGNYTESLTMCVDILNMNLLEDSDVIRYC